MHLLLAKTISSSADLTGRQGATFGMTARQCFWLLVEAQNFPGVTEDTQDLSSIRGGSAAMRLGVRAVDTVLRDLRNVEVETATIGGSVGIWQVGAENAVIQLVQEKVRSILTSGPYRHAAFSVCCVEGSRDDAFTSVRARLKAVSANQRYSEARLAYPLVEGEPFVAVCPVDMVRPVPSHGTSQKKPQGDYRVSRSVADRRRLGMNSKQTVIAEVSRGVERSPRADTILSAIPEVERPFAFQIASISESMVPDGKLRSGLCDKIAVIHLDGNGFTKIQDQILAANDTAAGQRDFDSQLQAALGRLIIGVLECVLDGGGEGMPTEEEAQIRQDLKIRTDKVVRFETLMWGGDEVMFIVPARLGWRVAETIASVAEKLEISVQTEGQAYLHPLTFGVGMVFCHHDAPIARIKSLADELAGIAKQDGVGPNQTEIEGRKNTRFVPAVMESFDHSGGDTEAMILQRAPGSIRDTRTAKSYMTLSNSELFLLRQAAEALRGTEDAPGPLSRSRLRLLARLVQTNARSGNREADEVIGENLQVAQDAGVKDALKAIDGAIWPGRFWRLLEEYWDYLLPLEMAADEKKGVAS